MVQSYTDLLLCSVNFHISKPHNMKKLVVVVVVVIVVVVDVVFVVIVVLNVDVVV